MTRQDHQVGVAVLAIGVGAALGLAVGAGLYVVIGAVLDEAGSPLVELQGFAWNLVPFGTVAGGVLGWWVALRRQRRRGP